MTSYFSIFKATLINLPTPVGRCSVVFPKNLSEVGNPYSVGHHILARSQTGTGRNPRVLTADRLGGNFRGNGQRRL